MFSDVQGSSPRTSAASRVRGMREEVSEMPQIIRGLYFGYGPVCPQSPRAEWRTESDHRAAIVWALAALIAVAFICARYGLP